MNDFSYLSSSAVSAAIIDCFYVSQNGFIRHQTQLWFCLQWPFIPQQHARAFSSSNNLLNIKLFFLL